MTRRGRVCAIFAVLIACGGAESQPPATAGALHEASAKPHDPTADAGADPRVLFAPKCGAPFDQVGNGWLEEVEWKTTRTFTGGEKDVSAGHATRFIRVERAMPNETRDVTIFDVTNPRVWRSEHARMATSSALASSHGWPANASERVRERLAIDADTTVFDPGEFGEVTITGRYASDSTVDGVSFRTFDVTASAHRSDGGMGSHYTTEMHLEGTAVLRVSDAALVELTMQGRARTLQSHADFDGSRGGRDSDPVVSDRQFLTFHMWSDCFRVTR